MRGGEYQINDGIEKMKANGAIFKPGQVDEWMDCGNKKVTVETNTRILQILQEEKSENTVSESVQLENAEIIPPCYIGENVVLKNSKIGPHVSLGDGTKVENSTIKNSLVQTNADIKNADLTEAMIGNHARYNGKFSSVSIGDYSALD